MKRRYTKEELVEFFPLWKHQIEMGDFKVWIDEKGLTHLEWSNTNVFDLVQSDIGMVIEKLYPQKIVAPHKRVIRGINLTGIEVVFGV